MIALIGSQKTPRNFSVSTSVRFRQESGGYGTLTRSQVTATQSGTWTFSCWFKKASSTATSYQLLFGADIQEGFGFSTGEAISFYAANALVFTTTPVFRDYSSWYHILVNRDNTTGNANLYVNENLISSFAYNSTLINNSTSAIYLGNGTAANALSGFLSEVYFVDGQALTPLDFNEINSSSKNLTPKKYTGTYGNNGAYLNFSVQSVSSTGIGKDFSGNNLNWTAGGFSSAGNYQHDLSNDSPQNNFCTLNPLDGAGTISRAGGSFVLGAGQVRYGTISALSGKYYWEINPNAAGFFIGVRQPVTAGSGIPGSSAASCGYNLSTGAVTINGITVATYGTYATAVDIFGIAIDATNNLIWFSKNGVWQSGDPTLGTGGIDLSSVASTYLSGWMPSIGVSTGTLIGHVNFGYRPFSYQPGGFLSLSSVNLQDPAIINPASSFAATLYTGNGTTTTVDNTVNSVSFQPDLVWIKSRNATLDHALCNSVRGSYDDVATNLTAPAQTNINGLSSFNANGFTVGSLAKMNQLNTNFVAYQWKGNGYPPVTNNDGTIQSLISSNQTTGTSIVYYVGTSSAATVGHGLGKVPSFILFKNLNVNNTWAVYHSETAQTTVLLLPGFNTGASTNYWNSLATNSIFSVNTSSATNPSGLEMIAFCFSEINGYSKFTKYTGNASTTGPFVYCGFKPKFIIIKAVGSGNTEAWVSIDLTRNKQNLANSTISVNSSAGESTILGSVDFLSNGFKIRSTAANTNNLTYIVAAWAESPFKYALAN